MAAHSSTLAWKILWTEEPGRLQSMGSLRVGHEWVASLSLFTFMHWRRKWQPIPVFLPGESQGRGSLMGCHLMGSHRVGHDWSDLAAAAAAYSMVTIVNTILHIWKWIKKTDLKSSQQKKIFVTVMMNVKWACCVISQYIQIPNHYVAYLKQICYMSIISQKLI